MKVRWSLVALVVVLAVSIVLMKGRLVNRKAAIAQVQPPAVVLVADFGEADDPDNTWGYAGIMRAVRKSLGSSDCGCYHSGGCTTIIRAVREASKRGVHTVELAPDSASELLRRYRLFIAPTVLVLDESGKETDRFEGESAATVKAVQTRLAKLAGASK